MTTTETSTQDGVAPTDPTACPLAPELAQQLREHRAALTQRWLERIAARVALPRNHIFPTDELLDHVPLLIEGIADYLADPAREITADVPVVAKAMELGELRHRQGFDAYEILKEYELLGGVVFAFLVDAVEGLETPCGRGELLICAQRLFRALAIIQQTTLMHFLELANERVREREQRLGAFNRALSHELKNSIGAVLGAGDLLATLPTLTDGQRTQFTGIIVRSAREMQGTLENLLDLTRLEGNTRQQRHIELPQAVNEVARRLRDSAEARGVVVEHDDIPRVEVNAAAMELMLTNFVSNAIKYSDPAVDRRWVRVSAAVEPGADGGPSALVVRVADNGLGVPEDSREHLFERFYRAHEKTVTEVAGTGLGLHIVRETAESLGGRAWAEFPERGSVFGITIPCRREADRLLAGLSAPAAGADARAPRIIRDPE